MRGARPKSRRAFALRELFERPSGGGLARNLFDSRPRGPALSCYVQTSLTAFGARRALNAAPGPSPTNEVQYRDFATDSTLTWTQARRHSRWHPRGPEGGLGSFTRRVCLTGWAGPRLAGDEIPGAQGYPRQGNPLAASSRAGAGAVLQSRLASWPSMALLPERTRVVSGPAGRQRKPN